MRIRFRSFVPWILVATPIAVSSFGCYGATQVTVALSTDLACDGTLDALVYKGAPRTLDSTPNAETKACTAATLQGADNDIGTLTLTPSGDKNAQVEVKAVLARNGKNPAGCDADATDCIVATRTFSFSEHSSQTVSIRLLQDCLGTACPEGQTCIGAGQCTTNSVTCTDPGGCSDAGTDGGIDGGSPGGACESRGDNGILARSTVLPEEQLSTIVRGLVVSSIYWYESQKFHHVLTNGVAAPGTTATSLPTALADGRDSSLVSLVPAAASGGAGGVIGSSTNFFRGKDSTLVVDTGLAVAATATQGVVAGSRGIYLLDGTTGAAAQPVYSIVADRLALANGVLYAASSSAGVHILGATRKMTSDKEISTKLGAMPAPYPFAFAVHPTALRAYVAGVAQTGAVTIVSLTDSMAIHSMALDDTHLYWTHGDDGIIAFDSTRTEKTIYTAKNTTITNVNVDNDCVYFWEGTTGGAGVLRAISRPQ